MAKKITIMYKELKNHAPFTSLGALTGLILMFFFKNIEPQTSETLFYIFHPAHVVLSALVTAAMFSLYMKKAKFITVLLVGYVGAIGIATLSDSIIPFLGEKLIGFHPHAHIGFIEKWYIVNPAAILGVIIAYFLPKTKFPHAAHVLLSTWASAFHMLIALNGNFTTPKAIMCFAFLFLAVWLPCCISDIIFPLLFVNSNSRIEHHH